MRRFVVLAIACTALTAGTATPASAGLLEHTLIVPITVGPLPGTGSTFQLALLDSRHPPGNTTVVSGQLGPAPYAGVLVFHSFDRVNNIGHYRLTAVTAAGTPLDSVVDLTLDRYGKLVIVGLDGFIGGTPFALSRTFVIPI